MATPSHLRCPPYSTPRPVPGRHDPAAPRGRRYVSSCLTAAAARVTRAPPAGGDVALVTLVAHRTHHDEHRPEQFHRELIRVLAEPTTGMASARSSVLRKEWACSSISGPQAAPENALLQIGQALNVRLFVHRE